MVSNERRIPHDHTNTYHLLVLVMVSLSRFMESRISQVARSFVHHELDGLYLVGYPAMVMGNAATSHTRLSPTPEKHDRGATIHDSHDTNEAQNHLTYCAVDIKPEFVYIIIY